MATKKRKAKRKARRRETAGYAYQFHGSFGTRVGATAKAKVLRDIRGLHAWVVSRKVTGMRGLRYIVLADNGVPF